MNINRDYLIINDVKKSNVKLDNGSIFFYITDKNTQNIFVNLVINISNNDLIQKYANIENAEDYTLTMNIVKPSNTYKVIEGKLHDKEKAIFEFNLNEDCCDETGTYKCELLTKCNIDDHEEITTSNKLTYKVKSSVLNDLDDIAEAPQYPLVIQLFDKLSDIEQYEEDRRANELARQLAEEQRQARFNALDADMTNSIEAIDDKVIEIENRISAKEEAVNTLIVNTKANIDNYKVVKDQEIDEYKALKDTEINNAITAQDNKIDTAINAQNDRIAVVENNDVVQDNRLDILENTDTTHEARMAAIEAKNTEQDTRLDAIEAIDVVQNTRLDAIESKNTEQDDRLLDIEKVNKRQDMDLKCLFAESKNNMIDITEEGNSIYLQNSTTGYTLVDEIKGNTLVNCNKEPDKEIILNGNINTQGYGDVTLTEGVNGGLVDIALEGNTMINVCGQKDSVSLPLDKELTYLYPSTQYAVQFVSDAINKIDITLGGTELLNQDVVVGTNKYIITTPSTLVDNKLVVSGVGSNIEKVVVTNTNTDREFGYFEGMKSVGECEDLEVVISNKNLLNNDNCISSNLCSFNDGVFEILPGEHYYVELANNLNIKNKTITISISLIEGNYVGGNVLLIGSDNKIFKEVNIFNLGKYTITVENLKAIQLFNTNCSCKFNLQIEEGDIATDYIPHTHNTQALTHEPLRAVGDVKDKYVLIDGKWYIERNCGEVVLDGSDDEEWHKIYFENRKLTTLFYMVFDAKKISDYNLCNKVYCSNFSTSEVSLNYYDYEGCYTAYDGNLCLSINNSKLKTLDEVGLKQYLSEKPITVVYQLATPTYELINYNPFEVYSDITHISNNSTIPCNITVKNHGFNCLLKPSTTYTISSNLGLNTVTTPAALTEDCLRFMDTDTSDVTTMKDVLVLEGDWTTKADLIPSNFSGIESAFEQEYDAEKGKYKVNVKVANEDKSKENNITFYINEPLRGVGGVKDKAYVKDDKVVVERNCSIRAYEDGDFETYPTDKVNTVYPLAEPIYEEVEYNDTKLFIESFKNSTLSYSSNVPVQSKLWYSYSVPIVDTVAQTASISDQQDVMIIDLATQVAVMEMLLM